jgi:aspartyl-tRNA(Asn)/glutamyl-tRNA(Gln) amidotransferase subunit A
LTTESAPHGGPPGTIEQLRESFNAGSLSSVEAVGDCLRRIDEQDRALNCFITRLDESALVAAKEADQRLSSHRQLGLLDGIPIAVKDIFYISGVRCTAGSRILADNIASYDSPAVRRLKEAGAVIVGTTNLHEFASGVTNDNPHYGPVRNPWDQKRVPGGSSGGSAAAVASGMVPAALGTDTAGSVRIPAALCGVVGLKPTYGRVSRLGVIPLASSLDTVGVITRTAWDAAAVLQIVSGHDEGDPTTVEVPVPDYITDLKRPPGSARVGVPRKNFTDSVEPAVLEVFDSFIGKLEEMGCHVETMELDGWDEAATNFVPIRRAEASAFHIKWLESTPELYGDDVRSLLQKGLDVKAVEYINAVNSRPSLMQRFASSMAAFDFVATPTTTVPAPLLGEGSVRWGEKEVGVYPSLNMLTLPFNMVGFPAVSVPMGLVRGLPVGAQLAGKPFDEAGLLRLVHSYQGKFGSFPTPPAVSRETR